MGSQFLTTEDYGKRMIRRLRLDSTPRGLWEERHAFSSGLLLSGDESAGQVRLQLFGYSLTEVAPRQLAFVAAAEKALLDLVYLTPGASSPDYLLELRLQDAGALNMETLKKLTARSGKPKLIRTAGIIKPLLSTGKGKPL